MTNWTAQENQVTLRSAMNHRLNIGDPAPEAGPALRISNIVYGRQPRGNRVTYLVHPRGQGQERAVPETVVLKRWRARKASAYRFGGCRLSSTLWRAVALSFKQAPEALTALSVAEIQAVTNASETIRAPENLRLPPAEALRVMFEVIGGSSLKKLIARHAAPERGNRSGVPDLFLYALSNDGHPAFARFVEVKKPDELVRTDQAAEIDFMKSLGLQVRVLRLIERSS